MNPDSQDSSPAEAAKQWRGMDDSLKERRRLLEDEGQEAVPSYRIGTAEGFSLFDGLGPAGKFVEEAFDALQARLIAEEEKARKKERDKS